MFLFFVEKMEALKKAYAEIIFNTAKEAAGQVAAAERKVAMSHRDLCGAKDESLRLLVRLKQMNDAKVIEKEITTSSQQIKIDELESQLQEAENMIVDLRAEVGLVRDKLRRVRKGQIHVEGNVLREVGTCSPSSLGLETVTSSASKNLPSNVCHKRGSMTQQSGQGSITHLVDNCTYSPETDLASALVRNKEHEMSRCLFIRETLVSKENLFAKMPLKEMVNGNSNEELDLGIRLSTNDDGKCNAPSAKTEKLENMKKLSAEELRNVDEVHNLPRRSTRFLIAKAKYTSSSIPSKHSYRTPSILSRCRTYSPNGNVESNLNLGDLPIMSEVNGVNEYSNDVGQKRISCDEKEQGKSYAFLLKGGITCGGTQSRGIKSTDQLNSLPRLDPGLTLITGRVDPVSGSKNVAARAKVCHGSDVVSDAVKNKESIEKSVTEEQDANINLTVRSDDSELKMANVPPVFSDLEGSTVSEETRTGLPLLHCEMNNGTVAVSREHNESSSPVDNEPIIKYTFQRKRKKEGLSSPVESTPAKESTRKRIAKERQNGSMEPPQTSSKNDDTSRNSRRLTQVARQLISLSGKRW